ncbi:A-kinase anchor protein 9 isoform X7 [Sciurus carolinensis]|uniref:A-kinase anchor protein 9 isoform X7 n=1 Tax=Sciurus carolinensis TaxID=30640 RepID=UPI001FB460E5|nr:A-kinase anchor protein 9 isoform X7 [Sciurus carolinensis]
MEDEERQRKLAIGRAKLAEFRQRRARLNGQNPHKKPKKKNTSSSKQDAHGLNIDQSQSEEIHKNSSQEMESTLTNDSTVMRTLNSGEILKHEQVFPVNMESDTSTTADDYTSEANTCSSLMKTEKPTDLLREEEFGVDDSYSEQGAQYSQTHLELIENELAGKHETEELNRELEEMRATYGTEGLHQLQEFEAAIKQRDGIITKLTTNLQQARKEKDETMREFLELTEQSQKLQIQLQHLQASETLRNNTHSSTAADLLQAKQQILTHQQQLEEQDHLLEDYQKKKEDFKMQISFLQEKIKVYEMEQDKKVENSNKREVQEKEAVIEALNTKINELKDKVRTTDKLLEDLQQQVLQKNQEIASMKLELTNSKQKEIKCSEEIKQLAGTVEEMQVRNRKENQFETEMVQRMEQEMQRKLEQLRAELDETYGKQIIQMKQELLKQYMTQIEKVKLQHKEEIENALKAYSNITVSEDQVKLMNVAINELNIKLQYTNSQKEKLKEELRVVAEEKSTLQRQLEEIFQELNFLRDQIQIAKQTINEQESKLNEAHKSLSTVEALKAEIASVSESRKELELKHEAEVTNYKIKLEMMEREKNAVLDRMAESQEAELDKLRTQLLFSHEEELSKLKEDLEIEHRINIEKLKDSLDIHYKQQIDDLQNEMSQKIETMQLEKDNLVTKQNQLILEISNLKDLQNSKSEEMTLQITELQKEIENEKGTLEKEVQKLQLKTEFLEKQIKEKEDGLQETFTHLKTENNLLKADKRDLEDMLKNYVPANNQDEKLIFTDSKSISKDTNWKKEVEILTEENEDLKLQCIQLNEEIEKQRNTFSFAEKNFEVNYQELKEEYACLLKIKDDLEDCKNKQELEYESKLKALNEELHLQKINPATVKVKSSILDTDKTFVAHTVEITEVVEKDTTELMEKLAVTNREKLELSEKLSNLSEQLKQKHGEVNCLSEEIKSLKQEKEQVLLRCKELEIIINHHRAENIITYDGHLSSLQDGFVTITSRDSGGSVLNVGEDFGEESKIVAKDKISFENVTMRKENKQEELLSPSVTHEPSPGTTESNENDKLQQELHILKTEQNDLRLQMEAQHFCLSLIYSTHVDQVREYMENEKDKALCSLKEELISAQEEKIRKLQKMYQLELQNIKTQETGDEAKSLQMLIGRLQKAVSEECSYISKTLSDTVGELYIPTLKCDGNVEEKENSGLYTPENHVSELPDYRHEVQDFQENMQTLLNKVAEEYNKLSVLQTRLSKFSDEFGVTQETNMVKLLEKQYQERLEEEVAKVIVSMSIAFAQQSELSRLSKEKENTTSSKQSLTFYPQKEKHYFNESKLSQGQFDHQISEAMAVKFTEDFKPFSKELGEDEVLLSNSNHLDDILESEVQKLAISEEMSYEDKKFIVRESIHSEMLVSSMDASRQLIANEEQLEDMRQELVRQYEEHQQATELIRQAHMQQMERQREDQEQLQEEIKRLNRQLAQRSSLDNENLISERERVLLEELEALKQLSLAGREKLCCELRSSSTQTQNENESPREAEEQTLTEKELDRTPEDVPPDILSNERFALQKTNNRLLKILLEVVKTTAAVEETIGRHVLGILDRSSKGQSSVSLIWRSEPEISHKSNVQEEHTRGVIDESVPSYSEEGTELSRQLVRSSFTLTEVDPENEELMLNISSRLQTAVEKLLETISETNDQLEHAKVTQTELMRESFKQKQEAAESLKCLEELRERLHQEIRAREQLAMELSKAEGIIDGYADEKIFFERQIQEKTDIINRLEQELLCAGNRLHELEVDQQQMQEERELLSRQKEAMKAEAGQVEQRLVDAAFDAAHGTELLHETEKLMKEKLEVQCQAEKVRDDLQKQVKALEVDVEEQVTRFIELEQEKNNELMDIRQQNQALEKQLEKMRKFLDEQTVDREHERDVFQQEIQKLEQQLKVVPRIQHVGEHQTREVEQLTNHLKEKTDKCSELLLSKEQLLRDIQERNEEIEKLEFRVRELEQALLSNADTYQKVEDQKQLGSLETEVELSLEVQLQAERDAIDRKEKEINNLEEQLEQFREELENKIEEVQQLQMQLEIQKKESTTRLQELDQENKLIKDEIKKLEFAIKESDAISTHDQHVPFEKFTQMIQEKEVEIDRLNEQITKFQQQLKLTTDNKTTTKSIHAKRESDFFDEIEALRTELVVTKEQLANCKERAEKLQEELLVKEMNMASLQKDLNQVRNQLTEARNKLSHFLEKEDKSEVPTNKKICLEPLPIEVGNNVASQTDIILKIHTYNQTPQILVRNAGIQTDLQSDPSSEEVTEIISQFTEKIEQMQELHAAEILDMESRHITETETLKKDHYIGIQLLTEECSTLKSVVQCLRSKEGSSSVPELTYLNASQSKEICTNDSRSDWNQESHISEGREEGESLRESFPRKITGLLRAVFKEGVQVLSLTESPYGDGEDHSAHQVSKSCLEERRAYLNTISSLKDLITKMQVQRESEVYDNSQSHESLSDWRGEFLLALQNIFLKEHNVLLAIFQTELTALGNRDAVGLLNCLEQRLQQQGMEFQAAMQYLQRADRRSMLSEIEALRAQVNGRKMTLKREQEIDKPIQELLEYNVQQKQAEILEMQVELSNVQDKTSELKEQMSSEKMIIAELKSELAQTELELETTLKAQHKHLKDLEAFRSEVKEKTDELHLLTDTLASEQKKSRELQWALEKEKAKLGLTGKKEKEQIEDLKFSLEDQKQRNIQLNLLLEQQKQLLNESQQKIESQKMLYDAQLSEEQCRNLELQVLLDSEKVRIQEMSSSLDRERELRVQLQIKGDSEQPWSALPSNHLLIELQKQLAKKHNRIVELLNETEKYKLDSLQIRQQIEKDRQVHRKMMEREQNANTEGQKKIHELHSKIEDLQQQLEEKRHQVYKLDLERKRLQGILQEFQKQELSREENRESRRILYQNLNENCQPSIWSLTNDRTRNWVLQQKIGETKESNYPQFIEMNGGETGYNHELQMIGQKLQCVTFKLRHLAQKTSNRLQFETADHEAFIWIEETIDRIIFKLRKLPGRLSEEPRLVSPGSFTGALSEQLLRQNTELTGYISQLTEEKNGLRYVIMKLEEQMRRCQHTGTGGDYSSRFSFCVGGNIEAIIASEKDAWNREKSILQKALERAEAEIYKLKAELRNDTLQNLSPDSEVAYLKRIYCKYLKAESFRKALIYQKKYLLLMLGGFKKCEEATIALLAQMGGLPAFTNQELINRPKGYLRFRSVVRVSIAISRMKILIRRWHQVTDSGSTNINRDDFELTPGTEKNDPFYPSGGPELCGEPRHTAYRSRPDLDYPRSPLPFQNRSLGIPADLNRGSIVYSHLQSYDPDRALTDYITRLEALQRRLGTVYSGPTTPFYSGMRR